MKHSEHSASHATAKPCVWMTAGVLRYRLCDHDYRCEICPLDAVLRGTAPVAHEDLPDGRGAGELSFPGDRCYQGSHTWTQELSSGRVRCGIDALAARLLETVIDLVLPAPHGRFLAGRSCCWIRCGAGLVPILAPVSGTVVGRNEDLLEEPARLIGSPYGRGWLVDVAQDAPPTSLPSLTAAEARDRASQQLDGIRLQVLPLLAGRDAVSIGPAMPDGGQLLHRWADILGELRYRDLVLPLFTDGGSR